MRENSFLDEKEAKSVVSGQAGNREASAAPGRWARDHTDVASGLFQEGLPHHQAEVNSSYAALREGVWCRSVLLFLWHFKPIF